MAKPSSKFLAAQTALGEAVAQSWTIGDYSIAERFDIALASLATRRGREKDVTKTASALKLPLPSPSQSSQGATYGAFWLSPQQWMVEAPFASHEDIATILKSRFGEAASITDQTDSWVRFDVSGSALEKLFERLSCADLAMAEPGFATRTVIEHLGCYLVKRALNLITVYGPRSSARSLLHALETAARSII
ncbi:MAG: sarcosine oxidase subunit gamma [Alphaproteobacteria bacterium]|nr:sarcosine oxidase subunit gamma [Alphaproteobacteria bacterium]